MKLRKAWISAVAFACAVTASAVLAQGSKPGQRAEAKNMKLVGYNDLQVRSAYQPVIVEQKGRWIAYIGHHGGVRVNPANGQKENNGTSIVDVTNPKQPKYLFHIPGDLGEGESGGAQMVRICAGKDLPKGDPNKFYMLRVLGDTAHEMWDVTAPEPPQLITTIVRGLKSTHKNWWECDTGIAYLVSGPPDWRVRRMTKIYDLSDPAKPVFIRDYGLDGQQPGAAGQAVIADEHRLRRIGQIVDLGHAAHAPVGRPGHEVGDTGIAFPPVLVRALQASHYRGDQLRPLGRRHIPHLVRCVAKHAQHVELAG